MSYRRVFGNADTRLANAVVVWDPHIHFALVRGTRSCPPLQVYDPENLEDQLNHATSDYCAKYVEVAPGPPGDGKTHVLLPAILEWYHDDFGSTDQVLLRWVARYLEPPKARILNAAVDNDTFHFKYRPFDWTLNKKVRPGPPRPTGVPSGVRRSAAAS